MKLRNRMIADRPRIEVPVEESSQEESVSSTAPQVGSPISTRTRSVSATDSQQPLTPILEQGSSFTRGQHAQYFQFGFNEDFILYAQSDADDGLGEEQTASAGFLSPHQAPRSYRAIAPHPEPQPSHAITASSSSTGQDTPGRRENLATQQQLPSMHIELPNTPQANNTMMPQFEQDAGPWSPGSNINAEQRKRALSDDFPGITMYPKDRDYPDKMEEALQKIETTPEGQAEADAENQRSKRRRKKRNSLTPSKSTKNDNKRRKDGDGKDGGHGGGQAVIS